MEVPRHWRSQKQRYSLTGEVCLKCQSLVFPPRAVCPVCGGEEPQPEAQPVEEAIALQSAELKEALVRA